MVRIDARDSTVPTSTVSTADDTVAGFKPNDGTNLVRAAPAYDREFTTALGYRVRRRVGVDTDRGDVTRFVVQLEYRVGGEWLEVVRFDHDPVSEHGHDVTVDGVHMDVYRDGRMVRTEEIFPPTSANDALTFVEEHLAEHVEGYLRRFERWHGTER